MEKKAQKGRNTITIKKATKLTKTTRKNNQINVMKKAHGVRLLYWSILSQQSENVLCRLKCLFDIFFTMRSRHKTCFIRRRREINSALEHTVKKLVKPWDIAGHNLFEVCDFLFLGKEKPKHASDMIRSERNSRLICHPLQPFYQLIGARIKGRVHIWCF